MSSSPDTRRAWTSDGGSGPRGRRLPRRRPWSSCRHWTSSFSLNLSIVMMGGHQRSTRNSGTDTPGSSLDRISRGVSFPRRRDTRSRASTRGSLVDWGPASFGVCARQEISSSPSKRFRSEPRGHLSRESHRLESFVGKQIPMSCAPSSRGRSLRRRPWSSSRRSTATGCRRSCRSSPART